MRLLDAKAITASRSEERKLDIDEGAKLAKKIDVLRQTASVEEQNLAKFRESSLKKVREDIEEATQQKNHLLEEIKGLESYKVLLTLPLDLEWKQVMSESSHWSDIETTLDQKRAQLIQAEEQISQKRNEIKTEKERIETERIRTTENLAQAVENKLKTAKLQVAMEQKKAESNVLLETKRKDMQSREAALAAQERDLQITKEQLEITRQELKDKEKFINDRYQTLLRTIKRHGNPRTTNYRL